MSVPDARRDPNLRRFPLRRLRLPCGRRTLSLVVPRSLNAVLELGDRSRVVASGQAPMPYWAELWPASVGVARAVMRGEDLCGKTALDLGCGLGLGGIACGLRGAAVTFFDCDPDALSFARFNAAHNGSFTASCFEADWHRTTAPGTYDVMILADVAYDLRNFEPLLRHLRQVMAPGGLAWFADPFRSTGDEFLATAAAEFAVESREISTHVGDQRCVLRLAAIRQR